MIVNPSDSCDSNASLLSRGWDADSREKRVLGVSRMNGKICGATKYRIITSTGVERNSNPAQIRSHCQAHSCVEEPMNSPWRDKAMIFGSRISALIFLFVCTNFPILCHGDGKSDSDKSESKVQAVRVRKAGRQGTQLLYFGATWCQPCQAMKPTITKLQREGFPIRHLDVDQHGELASRFGIQSVPAFVLVDAQGQYVDAIKRATDYDTLRRMLVHYQVPARMIPGTTVRGQSPARELEGIRVANVADFPRPGSATKVREYNQNRGTSPLTDTNLAPLNVSQPNSQAGEAIPGTQLSARDKAMASSVRLRVEDEVGHSFGTGTVVDVHGNEALILTCGHIFRESEGKGRILIDRFDVKLSEPSTGTLISYDIDRDVALVSVKLSRPMQVAKLAPLQYQAQKSERVFSIGCNQGAPPTVLNGQINQVDKYLGPPNITVSGRPVNGRSGGGLFNADGELIGVCSAADPEIDEGIYGALPRVYYELDRNGLSFVYQGNDSQATAARSAIGSALPETGTFGALPTDLPSLPTSKAIANEAQTASPSARRKSGVQSELVCVLRGEDGNNQAYVIKNPSPVLLEYLQRESTQPKP